jgi:hypothetical protein
MNYGSYDEMMGYYGEDEQEHEEVFDIDDHEEDHDYEVCYDYEDGELEVVR